MTNQEYNQLKDIKSRALNDKSVLIIGGGFMGKQYAHALAELNVNDVTIITRGEKQFSDFSNKFEYNIIAGGFEKHLPTIGHKDLVVIATPTELIVPAAKLAIKTGQDVILLEKPGSLFHQELFSLNEIVDKQKVRVGYNRLLYPNFHKLKVLAENEGGITSCKFDFTEWTHKIPFNVYQDDEYKLWGISNSLHVISMAFELIGMPKELSSYQFGKLDWHPSGSVFIGSGISEQKIPFSYHANWESSGRWAVEIMTKKNAYRLIPLEGLYVCKKGTTEWKPVDFEIAFEDTKFGIAEEIVVMLDDKLERKIGMTTLEKAIQYNKLAEKIFDYNITKT